jgi:hypothetical protein
VCYDQEQASAAESESLEEADEARKILKEGHNSWLKF